MDDWFTMASPPVTRPSSGIMLRYGRRRSRRVDVLHGDKQLLPVRAAHPRAVDVQRHGPRQIGDGLFVRPVLQQLAEAEHEHHGACRIEIAADQ